MHDPKDAMPRTHDHAHAHAARTGTPRTLAARKLGILALTTLALAGCGGSSDSAEPAPTSASAAPTAPQGSSSSTEAPATEAPATTSPTLATAPGAVGIVDYEFVPEQIDIAVGETVTWTNQDAFDHWVLSVTPDAIDSATMVQANSYSQTFTEPGTYEYFCNIHNIMKGSVVVAAG